MRVLQDVKNIYRNSRIKKTISYKLLKTISLTLLLPTLTFLSACEPDELVTDTMNQIFMVPGTPIPATGSATSAISAPTSVDNTCYVDAFSQPEGEITRKIDILFVVDTSGSLSDEKAAIANGIESFIGALPSIVDYQMALLLAHGSQSSESGKLFKYKNEPIVLSSSELTLAEIKTKLRYKLDNTKTDSRTDGGEVGLYSLNRILDHGKLTAARAHGFFREDAALAIIFVADENDICATYPEGVTAVPDPNRIEPVAKASYCTRRAPATVIDDVLITPAHDEDITPELVVGKLKLLQAGRPLLVSGILYNNPSTIPHVDENELGYGYLETIDLANGLTVDLASGDYSDGLEDIGLLATAEMTLISDFNLTNTNIDTDSIAVYVDGIPETFTFDSEINQIHLDDPGGPSSTIEIAYCEILPETPEPEPEPLPEGGAINMCLEGTFTPKATLSVGISIDPAEGSMPTIIAGLNSIGVSPVVYPDGDIASGKPIEDGVTVLIISRNVVVEAVDDSYVDGVKNFIANGGSILAEYDGAALLFSTFNNIHTSFITHMTPAISLFDGNAAGGGLLLPVSASTITVTDTSDPIMQGVSSTTISSGLKTAFAISEYDANWLHASATFTSIGYAELVPAGTYPAVMSGRCGTGRVAMFSVNLLQSLTNLNAQIMTSNALNWLIEN